MDFQNALSHIKAGGAATRNAWPFGSWVGMHTDSAIYTREGCGTDFSIKDHVVLITPDNSMRPWAPSQDDLLTDDWAITDPKELHK